MLKLNASLLTIVLLGLSFVQPKLISVVSKNQDTGPPGRPYEERDFYYDGQKWAPAWFQCDGGQDVAVLLKPSEATTQALLRFSKSQPQQKRTIELQRQEEPDCGMMKCWWSFKAMDQARSIFSIQESHYYDPEEGFWTNQYRLGIGANQNAARARLAPCRWFPRIRVAAITDRQSIYITETPSGGLLLRAFGYSRNGRRPSLIVANGVSTLDKKSELETYTFRQKAYGYVIAVSLAEHDPRIDVRLTKRRETIRKEDCLSYAYVKKF